MTTHTVHPTKLTEVRTEFEAAMIVAALEDHGIQAHLTGEYTAGFRAEAPGNVNILVRDGDLAAAQQILAEFGKQADTDPEPEPSATSFRTFCRKTVLVGLVLTALMYLVRISLMLFNIA